MKDTNKMKLEYVLSGISYFSLGRKRIGEDEELISHIKNIFDKFNEYYPNNPGAILFNAFTEKDQASFVPKYGTKTYVDSGGLQIITVKKQELTEDMKLKIYETQAMGDYAMCFDEIPLYIDEDKKGAAARTDMSGKYVVGEQVYDKGVATGSNIRKQIDYFKSVNAKTKVFIILQGNSPDDWMNFSNGVFSQIDWEQDIDYIEGLAIADTCIGNGILEALDMYSIIPKLNCPDSIKKRLHLLGVGTLTRLSPIISLVNSGYLAEDTYISYDSTSLSSNFIFGTYYTKGKEYRFPKVESGVQNKVIDMIVDDIQANIKKIGWNEFTRLSHDEFKEYFTRSTSESFKTIYENECPITEQKIFQDGIIMFALLILSQLANFTEDLMEIISDEKKFKKYLNTQNKTKILNTLKGIKTYDDYLEWRKFAINSRVHSNRIARVNTYEEFLAKTTNKKTLADWF